MRGVSASTFNQCLNLSWREKWQPLVLLAEHFKDLWPRPNLGAGLLRTLMKILGFGPSTIVHTVSWTWPVSSSTLEWVSLQSKENAVYGIAILEPLAKDTWDDSVLEFFYWEADILLFIFNNVICKSLLIRSQNAGLFTLFLGWAYHCAWLHALAILLQRLPMVIASLAYPSPNWLGGKCFVFPLFITLLGSIICIIYTKGSCFLSCWTHT